MSLLDNGPHTVTVFLEREYTDHRGNIVREPDEANPVVVSGCWMQPLGVTQPGPDQDQRVRVQYKFIARSAPVGPWSRVAWQGRNFSVVESPRAHESTAATSHVIAILREER